MISLEGLKKRVIADRNFYVKKLIEKHDIPKKEAEDILDKANAELYGRATH